MMGHISSLPLLKYSLARLFTLHGMYEVETNFYLLILRFLSIFYRYVNVTTGTLRLSAIMNFHVDLMGIPIKLVRMP